MANLKSIEFKHGIATTSDAHLNAKYEVATLVERDLLITSQSIKRGAQLYFNSDSEPSFPRGVYFLNTHPSIGSLTGVVWSLSNGGSDSAAEVKAKYESNADTNAYNNADKAKLDGISVGATVDQTALEVPFTPTGNTIATNVQAAIEEIQAELDAGGVGGGAVDSVNAQTGVVTLDSDNIPEGSANLYNQTHIGEVTGDVSLTISEGSVTNTKLTNVSANTMKGRVTAGTGVVEDLSQAQGRAFLSIDNVDNTTDLNKPISTAAQTALNLKSDKTETLAPWAAGTFNAQTATVIHDIKIYKLVAAAPFVSTDIDAEILAQDWVEVSISFPKPVIKTVSPLVVGQNSIIQINGIAGYLDEKSNVTIGALTLTDKEFDIVGNTFSCQIDTTALALGTHVITISNSSGLTIFDTLFEIAIETVIVPNGASWDAADADLLFSAGAISPNSLNSVQRTCYYDVVPENRDFEVKFSYNTSAIVSGTITNETHFGISLVGSVEFDARQGIENVLASELIGASVYNYSGVLDNKVNNDPIFQLTPPSFDDVIIMYERINGVLRLFSSTDIGVSFQEQYTLALADQSAYRVWAHIGSHTGIDDISITLKV
jgi:hypothetical protein